MTLVYNSAFSIFPLQGARVYKNNHNIEEKIEISTDGNNDESDIVETLEDKVINIFGKERTPNSYSELPLKTSVSELSDDEDSKENNEEDEIYIILYLVI